MNIYHFIDFPGFGTVHKLITELGENHSDNKVIMPINGKIVIDNDLIKKINEEECIIIIHASGRLDSYYLHNYKRLFINKRLYMFMHVSPKYLILKKRDQMFKHLKEFVEYYNGCILTPSKQTTQAYIKYGLRTKTIQMGIKNIKQNKKYYNYIPELSEFYDKIITTCTSDEEIYRKIKGVDRFERLLNKLKIKNLGLICGNDNIENLNIKCKKFTTDQFLNILCHSKAYVQLSRLETYNLTAVQAKRFKIPVFLLRTEGTPFCMNGNVYKNLKDLELELKQVIAGNIDIRKIERLYQDSLTRESLENFNRELLSLA